MKRKPRTNLINKVDMLKPVNLLDFGTENDPCFGKYFDPKTAECGRCGDSELCAIKLSQNNDIKRTEVESKQAFKDMEEKDIPNPDQKEILQKVRKRMKELLKKNISEPLIINDLYTTYNHLNFNKKRLTKILQKVLVKWNKK